MLRIVLTSISVLLVSFSTIATGTTPGFIEANGFHPIKALFGFPVTRLAPNQKTVDSTIAGETAQPTWRIALQADHSNIFSGGASSTQTLILDGESTRINLAINYNRNECLAAGVSVPFVTHHPGSLDQFIETWHEIFGLPDGRRDLSPQDRLRFEFLNGSDRLQLTSSTARIGDLQLQLATRVFCYTHNTVSPLSWLADTAVRFGLKLPTGSLQQFTGSESLDWFFDVTPPAFKLPYDFQLMTSLGALLIGDTDDFDQLRSNVFFATAAFNWQPAWLISRGLSLTVQADLHSPLFDSELRELGANGTQLGISGQWQNSGGHRIVFGFLEDSAIDTAPDFVIHLGYQRYW